MRASQHFLYRWPLPGSGFLKINSLLFNDCYILLSRNILAADFYWQRHFLKSILHLGISEEPKFKIRTYAKGLLYTCSIREKESPIRFICLTQFLPMQLHCMLGFSQQTAADLLGLHFLPGQTLWKFLGVFIFQGIITDY